MTAPTRPIKVWLVCTGVGTLSRGIETFARECFDGLHGFPGLDIELLKGAGPDGVHETRLWNLPRTGVMARTLGWAIRRNSYVAEQLSSFLPLAFRIRRDRPDVIFTSEANLRFQLYRWRAKIGVPFKILYSNGGPCHPPFIQTDFVQQVVPYFRDEALAAGEPAAKHFLVPYGIRVPPGHPVCDPDSQAAARRRLGLSLDRKIVLSVGWISAGHKRMDYVVREIASLGDARPFLVLLGHVDEASEAVLQLAHQLLDGEGYLARTVPYQAVEDYYCAADVFTLGSLQEGFGRVYLEALIAGLPCAVHRHPVMQYVLGDEAHFADFSAAGGLAEAVRTLLAAPSNPEDASRRREFVRAKFSWETLAPAYLQMFKNCLRI